MNKTLTYALLVFIAGSSYGFIVPIVKIALSYGVDANDFLPMQYIVAFIVMGTASVFIWKRSLHPKGIEWLKLVFLGVLAACTSLCYYRAVVLLPGAVAVTMLFQFVWIGPLIDCVVGRFLPQKRTVAAIAVVLVGTLFAAGVFDQGVGHLDAMGVILGLLSAVFYSLFLFCSSRLGTQFAVPIRTTMLSVGGFATTFAANPLVFANVAHEPLALVFAAGMGFVGVIIPTSLIAFASPKLSPSMTSIMASSELPMGVLAAWALASDEPTALCLFGVVLVLAGILINQMPALRRC